MICKAVGPWEPILLTVRTYTLTCKASRMGGQGTDVLNQLTKIVVCFVYAFVDGNLLIM